MLLFRMCSGNGRSGLPWGSTSAWNTNGSTTLFARRKLPCSLASVLSASAASASRRLNCPAAGSAALRNDEAANTSVSLLMYSSPGSICGSKKNTL